MKQKSLHPLYGFLMFILPTIFSIWVFLPGYSKKARIYGAITLLWTLIGSITLFGDYHEGPTMILLLFSPTILFTIIIFIVQILEEFKEKLEIEEEEQGKKK